ncbi:hexameric tyrosine-coordinated heme protein [Marinobacter zhanjiangensis]|uniref:hexameric tyrosine-coordinated heme protein n=1 Tax=Marinobacter zhanjiangensis TaxID=578215 RepID=UPI001D1162A7|nr:hexameric tyrosine-coordinated heme protein [Marinobacter zhanjiangensis]
MVWASSVPRTSSCQWLIIPLILVVLPPPGAISGCLVAGVLRICQDFRWTVTGTFIYRYIENVSIRSAQSDKEVLVREREEYAQEADALMHASEVIAIHFQTVAAAKDYWK